MAANNEVSVRVEPTSAADGRYRIHERLVSNFDAMMKLIFFLKAT